MPGASGDLIPIEARGTNHAECGKDEHMPAQEREKCDTRSTGAAPDLAVGGMYITSSHIREYCAQHARGLKRADQCHTTMRIRARMEQNDDGGEGLKEEEEQMQERLEKSVLGAWKKIRIQTGRGGAQAKACGDRE